MPSSMASFARYGGASAASVAARRGRARARAGLWHVVRAARGPGGGGLRSHGRTETAGRPLDREVGAGLPDPQCRPTVAPSLFFRALHFSVSLVPAWHAECASTTRCRLYLMPRTPPPAARARTSRDRRGFRRSAPSCVPRAATRPPSSTMISSAREIVDSRWAMMMVVRPFIASRRPRRIRASVVASTEAVASSRMRMRGSIASARAIATRWRCPPDSVIPRSPTSVS